MSNIVPFGMDATTGQNKIGLKDVDTYNGTPVIGSTPTLVVGAAATGATTAITGSNSAGKITVTTTASLLSSGVVLTMTFGGSFAFPNGCVVLFSSGNSNFASILQYLYVSATTTTTATLNISIGLSISSTYIGYYQVIGW